MFTVTTDYGTFNVEAFRASYHNNGTLAVSLKTTDGEPFCTLTVNLVDGIASDEYQYVDTNNCPWALDFIESNGLGVSTGITTSSGFWQYPLVRFNIDKIKRRK